MESKVRTRCITQGLITLRIKGFVVVPMPTQSHLSSKSAHKMSCDILTASPRFCCKKCMTMTRKVLVLRRQLFDKVSICLCWTRSSIGVAVQVQIMSIHVMVTRVPRLNLSSSHVSISQDSNVANRNFVSKDPRSLWSIVSCL